MVVANLTYAYQNSPWDSPMSLGVQAFIEYNGYILNDRHQADRIRVTGITGLDDSDISDSREVIPGDEGEFVYDSWARGRTFVMNGEFQAGSLGTLTRMERDLKAAFGTLVESPMKFRWFDIYDSFDDPQTLQNYTAIVGSSGSLVVSGGVLHWPTTSNVLLMRSADNRLWADAQTTVRIIVGSVSDASSIFLVPALADSTDFVKVAYNVASGTPTLTIATVIGGTTHALGSVPVTGVVQGQSIWLRAKKEGDLITAEVWTTKPQETSLPAFSTSAWLTGSDSDLLGDQVLTQAGFGAQTADTNWALDDFRIESICPCDIAFNAKKLSPISIKDSQDAMTRFKRTFQITMRSSQPYGRCATQSRSQTLVPASGSTSELGFSSPMTSLLKEETFFPGTVTLENNILSLCNRGTATERPIIVIYGAINEFSLTSLTNGMQINWGGSLMDGDYLVFNCRRRTLVNSAGTNMKEFLSYSDFRWMLLEPQWNDLYLAGSGFSGNTKMVVWNWGRWK